MLLCSRLWRIIYYEHKSEINEALQLIVILGTSIVLWENSIREKMEEAQKAGFFYCSIKETGAAVSRIELTVLPRDSEMRVPLAPKQQKQQRKFGCPTIQASDDKKIRADRDFR